MLRQTQTSVYRHACPQDSDSRWQLQVKVQEIGELSHNCNPELVRSLAEPVERALAACLESEHPGTSGHRYYMESTGVTGELVTDETHFAPSVEYFVPTSTDIIIYTSEGYG